jgi:AcrR family transcriptional regulator
MSGTAEREAQREDVRERIVEAARDIVSEDGLDALSMRALALRIGHSPGTIYLHFQDKDELLRSVMSEGFKRLGVSVDGELAKLAEDEGALARYAAMGRGYARFALENTGYFRSMFKMPKVAHVEGCPEGAHGAAEGPPGSSRHHGVELLARAMEQGEAEVGDPARAALVGWGLIHGLTSLYLSGHLQDQVTSHEDFMELIESAIEAIGRGWLPR